ncbi:cytochrome c oxidase accessory protein CcoG [Chryseobacterium sp. POL2]|uniref:cytochrome c oxidase accessory protein CcoG n=1 Tax=Chryseobacterium sp. POL2 TaxID=2713414 RepID=UPI0013E10D2A|nr:cytochrome c oxidase accessory protein CcoG [Chryseobacterium sp. POL2]QIG88867.1 cytochrome c oxidase accessory protein CcoG [Chryseobacterium sp. POL2]
MSNQNQPNNILENKDFRDSVATATKDGKRKWVFPRKPKGKYTNYRSYTSYVLLALFLTVPFLKLNGNPFFRFNILDREFFIFGQAFYVQDFFIFGLGAVTSVIFVMVFTIVFGRIFCGWLCPQTLFMEMLFRKIEYWIEGDRNKQIKLDKQDWNAEKIRKKLIKWGIFAFISLLISHVMFMYIVGPSEVWKIMKAGPLEYPVNFIVMLVFTTLFYFVFAWLREQVCTLICPYGRLQGVLVDKQTINVYYDFKRGENRAKWRNGEDRTAASKGDCIDCNQCVVVCPTGIDIRNGQQLECINCTACIDACDEIMLKVGLPKGLIRYATEQEIETQTKFKFTARMKATAIALFVLIGFLGYLLNDRGLMEAKFLKVPGSSFIIQNNEIRNSFTYTIINKSNGDLKLNFKVLSSQDAKINLYEKSPILLKKNEIKKGDLQVVFPENEMKLSKQEIEIGVFDQNGTMITSYKTIFEGPFKLVL